MSKPSTGQRVDLWDERLQKTISVRVWRVTETHVTVVMEDKRLWCMTHNDFREKSERRN